MEKCGNPEQVSFFGTAARSACSACAGDYEDPDRTAWAADVEGEEDDEAIQDEERESRRG